MFYLKNKNLVVDGAKKVVGFISNKRFTQDDFVFDNSGKCGKVDIQYRDGLSPLELEQISELLQRELR